MQHDEAEISCQAIGLAGELRIMSELILRGHNPAKSYLDDGVDIILQDGHRIQVKTTYCPRRNIKTGGAYKFDLGKGHGKRRTNLSEYTDFLIGFIIPKEAFYVIPAHALDGIGCLSIPTDSKRSKYHKYLNRWEILGKGGEAG